MACNGYLLDVCSHGRGSEEGGVERGREGERGISGVSSYKGTNLIGLRLHSMTSSNLSYFFTPNTVMLGIRDSTCEL